jgi:hypothetical protein
VETTRYDGSGNYYVNAINKSSKYIWWGDHPDSLTTLGGFSGGGTTASDWGTKFSSIDAEGASGATFESLTAKMV